MTKNGIDLVIFDCDGVLVDSEVVGVEIDRAILAEHGWELPREEVIDRFLGRPFSHMRESLEQFLGEKLPSTWEPDQELRYFDAFERELQTVDGIEEALDGITIATCVASSGTHEKIRTTLGLTGLLPRFEGRIFSVMDVQRGKPAPDIFLHAAEQMGVKPERCIVIEDSKHGVVAARAAGMHVLGYAGGLTPQSWLEDAGAPVFDDMAQLPGLINE